MDIEVFGFIRYVTVSAEVTIRRGRMLLQLVGARLDMGAGLRVLGAT